MVVHTFPHQRRTSFAYFLFLHSFHACRDRVVLLPPCSLYGAATLRPPPLGPGRSLTLPCGWNNAGTVGVAIADDDFVVERDSFWERFEVTPPAH